MFLTIMVVGLVGLVVMALPAFGHQGHAGIGHAHGGHAPLGHAHGGHAHVHAPQARDAAPGGAPNTALIPADAPSTGLVRFLPSPRAVFTLLALYGAFGNALVRAGHLTSVAAALLAVVPAFVVEKVLVRPLFNLVFRFQGKPSAPLAALVFSEAIAVTPFRNERGLVTVVRDGRQVQLMAHLCAADANATVKVGDHLKIEDVDEAHERVIVSVGAGKGADLAI